MGTTAKFTTKYLVLPMPMPMPKPRPEGAEWIDAYRRWYGN